MEWVEVRAENIEAAEELALDQLGVAREDAEFEVVTREENRLFGLKKTEARVRARVKPVDLPAKTTNNQRKRSKNNNNNNNKKNTKTPTKNNNTNKKNTKPKVSKQTPDDREPMALKDQETAVIEFLEGVIASFQIKASASTRMEEERIIGSIDGEEVGLLIGPKAGTLLALQDITRTVVQRHASGRKTNRLSVDVLHLPKNKPRLLKKTQEKLN
jgi:spoIIIJ-associated protein